MKKLYLLFLTFGLLLINLDSYAADKNLDFSDESQIGQFSNHAASYTVTHDWIFETMVVEVSGGNPISDALYWWVKPLSLTDNPYISFDAKVAGAPVDIEIIINDGSGVSQTKTISSTSTVMENIVVEFTPSQVAQMTNSGSVEQIAFKVLGSSAEITFDNMRAGLIANPHIGHDASIDTLGFSFGTFKEPEEFDPEVTNYTILLPDTATSEPEVYFELTDTAASIFINNPAKDVTSSKASDRTRVIMINAEDDQNSKSYQILYEIDQPQNIAYNKQEFTIYPNPAHNRINLNGIPAEARSIRIINIVGQEVMNARIYNNEQTDIGVSGLEKGIYFLQLHGANGILESKRFLKR